MQILIDSSSQQPLYEQIMKQIQNEVIKGSLLPGEALPSIRYLARELKVSIITAKRAYEELEADGFIQTIPGKGSFVSGASPERLRQVAVSQVEEKLAQAVDTARAAGISLEEFQEIVEAIYLFER